MLKTLQLLFSVACF